MKICGGSVEGEQHISQYLIVQSVRIHADIARINLFHGNQIKYSKNLIS